MNRQNDLTAMLGRALVVMVGMLVLAGCGGGSSGGGTTTPTTTADASLSTSALTYSSQSVGTPTSAQMVTLNSTGTATLVLSGITITGTNAADFSQTNNCGTSVTAGANCAINVIFTPSAAGSRTAMLTVTDNSNNVSGTTQTVTLAGTGAASTVSLSQSSLTFSVQTMAGSSATPQSVTVNNTGTAALAISNIGVTGAFSQTNTCPASLAASSNCAVNVTFTPTAAGTLTGTLTLTDNSNGVAGTQQTVALTGSGFSSNTAALTVGFGANGTGPVTTISAPYFNGVFTTVTVCAPGSTTNCATVPNVLVDTGSVGLRVLSSTISGVTLPQIIDPQTSDPLYECVEYGDTTYTWGPMQMATVQVGGTGGETATQIPGGTANAGVPIQVITSNTNAPSPIINGSSEIANPCTTGGGGSDSTVAALGANGILGVGNYAQDCGADCTSTGNSNDVSVWPYLVCESVGSSTCELQYASLADQAWNPVSAFGSADNNGVILQLPSIAATGAPSVSGSLVFGIGTQTCTGAPATCTANALGTAKVYALDGNGNFPTTSLNGITYSYNATTNPDYGAFLDSGSNALFLSDATTLGIPDCYIGAVTAADDIGYYCPASTLSLNSLNFTLTDNNGVTTPQLGLSIANALNLFGNLTSPANAAFNNLGGDSGTSANTDYFDLGLPFFFGRNIFVGIMGTNAPNGTIVPNGYWAF